VFEVADLPRRSLAKAASAFSLLLWASAKSPPFSEKIFETFAIGSGENKQRHNSIQSTYEQQSPSWRSLA
jgi:hypothetical protein